MINAPFCRTTMVALGLVIGINSMVSGFASAQAENKGGVQSSGANPFDAISRRNAFGLRPPAPSLPFVWKQNPPEIDVKLAGIVTFFAKPKVVLSTKDPGSIEPIFQTLAEGERAGGLEILEIDVRNEQVKILLAGAVQVLDFKNSAVAMTTVEAPPTVAEPAAPASNEATSPRRKLYREL